MNAKPSDEAQQSLSKWQERIQALHNVPPLFRMVRESAPKAVGANVTCRILAGLVPLALLGVTQAIIAALVNLQSRGTVLPGYFWWLIALEFGLAGLATVLARLIDFCDSVIADKFTRHIGTQIMEHASSLDLTRFEDPVFCDKMERARLQANDRVLTIQMAGRLIQEIMTTVSLAAGILFYSPWLLVFLFACIVPAFLGQTHFAFLGYSLTYQQSTRRRKMEYLRILGGSKKSAKELKLFRLGPFLIERYKRISDELHSQNVDLAKRKLFYGSILPSLGTLGYYGTYAYVVHGAVIGTLTIAKIIFLTGAIAGASTNIQALFSTFCGIADQALFMTDLLDFFHVQPRIVAKPGALPAPKPIR